MRKILLFLFFVTSYWQVQAQLKISTSATKLCEGTSIPLQATGVPATSNLQWQKDGIDITNANTSNYSSSMAGSYIAKALGKDVKWNRKSPDIDYSYLRKVFFVNSKVGYATSEVNIIKTIDGGVSWKELNTNNYNPLLALHFFDEQTGWAVGERNTILSTKDGGNTWKETTRSDYWGGRSDNIFYNIFFIDSKIGWITDIGGVTLKTINGGTTWIH